jgi:arsenate reductase (thioredoxin)
LHKQLLHMSGITLRQPFNVLFLCTGNSARSILAECLLRHRSEGRFNAFSAGSFPKGQVHPLALRLLAEQGLSTDGLRSKSWNEFARPAAPAMDFVFTVCDQAAGEVCPVWPGQPITAHWGIPDPAVVTDDGTGAAMLAFRDAFRMLERRISLFVALPVASLDRLALKRAVDDIGRVDSGSAKGHAA